MPERERPVIQQELIAEIHRYAEAPPPIHLWIDVCVVETLEDNVTSTSQIIVNYTLPPGHVGIIRWFANSLGNPADYTNVTWSIRRSGAPVQGHANFVGPKAPSLSNPTPVWIALMPTQEIQLWAANATALDIAEAGGRFVGWAWPRPRPQGA